MASDGAVAAGSLFRTNQHSALAGVEFTTVGAGGKALEERSKGQSHVVSFHESKRRLVGFVSAAHRDGALAGNPVVIAAAAGINSGTP